jgi:hypothetical protein
MSVKRDAANNVVVTVEAMKDGPEGDTLTSRLEGVEVGTDGDGDIISSCVAVEAEPQTAPGEPKLSPANQLVLDMLHRAIADSDEPAPASDHIPPNTRTTTLVRWRSYCGAGTVAKSDNPDSQRRAFVRACD